MTASLLQILSHIRPGEGFCQVGHSYEGLYSPDGHAVPPLEEIEAARAEVEAALDADAAIPARQQSRSALRDAWNALPAWIRGPYRPLFDVANSLLDEGDDDAAAAMIEFAAPLDAFDATQQATFAAVKAQFQAGIESLPA